MRFLFLSASKPIHRTQSDLILSAFGLNALQLCVIQNAMVSQISVIECPHGTGKTQSILNHCHPQIINFCKKKFDNNELVILSKDEGDGAALEVICIQSGNHARGYYNQREIEVICDEILPTLSCILVILASSHPTKNKEIASKSAFLKKFKQIPSIAIKAEKKKL